MKNIIKCISVLISAVLLISVLPFSVCAAPARLIKLEFSEAENGKIIISMLLPPSDKLTTIDFSLELSSEAAVIESISTENAALKDIIYDFGNLPEYSTEKDIFTYTVSRQADRIAFSGFFLDDFTTEVPLHLCDIILEADRDFTVNDTFRFSCSLTYGESKESESLTYSLLNGDIYNNVPKSAYPSGDADLNGIIDANDARIILRASVGLDSPGLEAAPYADSDCDGKITAADARFALRFSVGLEDTILRSFDITPEEVTSCDEGGRYTFTCSITGISFSMDIANGGHICRGSDCINSIKCEICNEDIIPPVGHSFDANGICTRCLADKSAIDAATDKLANLLEEIRTYDILAEESLQNNKKTDFLCYTQEATKCLLNAATLCEEIPDLKAISEQLMTAYSIRFQAFISVTDENGKILPDTNNCNTILSAVKASEEHIAFASLFIANNE